MPIPPRIARPRPIIRTTGAPRLLRLVRYASAMATANNQTANQAEDHDAEQDAHETNIQSHVAIQNMAEFMRDDPCSSSRSSNSRAPRVTATAASLVV